MRYMPSGDPIASFSLAVGSKWKDKQGQKQESTEWVSVTAFGKLAEICGQYLKKGGQVFVSGRMKTDKYEKDGIERYSTKIIADRMQMLGGRGGSDDAGDHGDPQQRTAQQRTAQQPAAQRQGGSNGFDDMDDDIPF